MLTLDAANYTLDTSAVPFIPLEATPDFLRSAFQTLFQFSWFSYAILFCSHAVRAIAAGALLLGAYLEFVVGEDELFRWTAYQYALIALTIACMVIRICSETGLPDFIRHWSWGIACLFLAGCVILPKIYF